ncbi:multidrug transporter [Solibacillus sp. R5-41]|uniref:multidrug transporter n=1 Tax=Solibacillus sp. R5-41 TaxID=2048654 RepID=UPI0020A61396|nr:multidrug transporter [Solibacillus sp. R5-41]
MMFGSLFYNFWAALCTFAVYFIWAVQDPFAYPLPTIGVSLVVALIGFIAMFFIRAFIGYVLYTPENIAYSEGNPTSSVETFNSEQQQFVPQNERTTVEFEEDNTEEIAKVVRTMLHGQEGAVSK